MAEVRLRIGRRAYTFFKTKYKQSQLGNLGKQGSSAIQTASLETGNRSVDAKNIQERADRLRCTAPQTPGTPGTPPESLTRVPPRSCCFTDRVFVSVLYHVLGLKCYGDELLLCGLASYEHTLLNTRGVNLRSPHVSNVSGVGAVNGNVTGVLNMCEQRRTICTMGFANFKPQPSSTPKPRHGQQLSFNRSYGDNTSVPLYKTKTGYYDILKVSPNATHAQIKTAYYKQSFLYHPDRNAGSAAATLRFSEISEAYHVLGNKGLRKKYDRGVLSQGDLTGASPLGTDSSTATTQHTRDKHSPAVGANRANVFDFDRFIKSHYGDQLKREKEVRTRREEMQRKEEGIHQWKLGHMMEVCAAMLVAMAMAIVVSVQRGK